MSVSIDEELYRRLKRTAGSRGMSRFIAEAVREKLRDRETDLAEEYRDAQTDPDRKQVIEDWAALDTEGW